MIILGLDPGLATTGYGLISTSSPENIKDSLHNKILPCQGEMSGFTSQRGLGGDVRFHRTEGSEGVSLIDFGTIETPAKTPFPDRLKTIQQNLSELIDTHKPQIAVIEKLFFAKNTKTAIDVAQARGVLLSTCQLKKMEIHEFTPNQIKLSLTGDGSADKQQIQKMIMLTFQLAHIPKPDDAADAIAIALTYIFQRNHHSISHNSKTLTTENKR